MNGITDGAPLGNLDFEWPFSECIINESAAALDS